MSVDVSLLYDMCLRLEENHDSADFQFCIEAIKNEDTLIKKLAIQLVFRFFDGFPDKRAAALNTLMSQLKNPDVEVQKLVIKGLPSTCSRHEDYVDQVGDVLSQLLSIRDRQELSLVRKSLNSLLVKFPKATILAMYKAVTKAESIEDKLLMLRFMDEKVIRINGELTPFMKRQIAEVYCKMLVSSTPDEIELVLRFVRESRQITEQEKQVTLKAAMDCLVDEGVNLDEENDVEDYIEFNKVVNNVVKVVLILHSVDRSYIMPKKMTNYLFSKFDKLSRIHPSDRKDIMKVLSGITYLGNYEDPEDFSNVIKLFDFLKSMLPAPISPDGNLNSGCVGDQRSEYEWDIEFSEIELVSVVVYNILQRNRSIAEELLSHSDVWKSRFQYLVNVIRVYTRCLKKKLDEQSENKETDYAKNMKLLKIANNVGLIANCFLVNIRDLHVKISPSWIVPRRRARSRLVSFNRKRRRRDS
ncbi:Apoptosis inhibitory protein 5 [Trichostrongylus colubriformis]|uniref:Apoptosis inhibitory protein 5 n=1 Tax=Trichostrongylus colubriformis TaxID=6319 RepID=A0AAN8F4X3_TRICO